MSVDDSTLWDREPIAPELDSQPEIIPWTSDMVLRVIGVPAGADRETVLSVAAAAIDEDELTPPMVDALLAGGYPELDPGLGDEDSPPDDEYPVIGPDGSAL